MNGSHMDSDDVEAYSLGRMQTPEQNEAEEHLMICAYCRQRVASEDMFVNSIRAVLGDSSVQA